jgi:hypothetical protein
MREREFCLWHGPATEEEAAVIVRPPLSPPLRMAWLIVVKADGSGQRLGVEDAGNPEWSPDGQRLAFHRTVWKRAHRRRRATVVTFHLDDWGG